MAILLYCIAAQDASMSAPVTGVAGLPVTRTVRAGLTVFTSHHPDSQIWLRQQLRVAALEFHHVLHRIFESTVIIPFRYPTVFTGEEDLNQSIAANVPAYLDFLRRFAELVQMEIHVTAVTQSAASGTDFLKQRQESGLQIAQFLTEARAKLSAVAGDWRERASGRSTRAFILVKRADLFAFEAALRGATLPDGIQVRVSGPWPVSEFME
jgi:hypothetical protein